jgi:hypothetical protein
MTAHLPATDTTADELAREAARYLEVVEAFASLGADPHAAARARAAHARRTTNHAAQEARTRRRRWRG